MPQLNLFGPEPQAELFGENTSPQPYRADPAKIRAELLGVLARAKAAADMPWTERELRYHQTVFPQMSRWLPEDEARQLCFEFETELKRLLAA